MGTILQTALAFAIVAANFVYWWFVARHWDRRFRLYCERRYHVTITLGVKGHWSVSGDGSWLRRFAIGWLQLAFYMVAFVVWGAGMLLGVALLSVA